MQVHKPASVQRRVLLAVSVASLFFGGPAAAAPPVNTLKTGPFGRRGDTAIQGYDTVAYFTVGRATKGKDEFVHDWMGAKWKFVSQANLELFRADPEKYAPQYGGYCAYGVAQDDLVSIEPDKFSVIGGKLYLNYNEEVQATWRKDPATYIKSADAKFKVLLRP